MTLSLYDATIPAYLQILGAVDRLLDKAAAFAAGRGMAEGELIEARLAPDMLPFGYQVKSCVAHSTGAIEGVRAGHYTPDMTPWPGDVAGLHAAVRGAITTLEAIDTAELETLAGRDTEFRFGEMVLPFTGANFLLSFAQPNFYFHATTAYAILRAQGVALGKTDFMGRPRIGR